MGYSPYDRKEVDMTEHHHKHRRQLRLRSLSGWDFLLQALLTYIFFTKELVLKIHNPPGVGFVTLDGWAEAKSFLRQWEIHQLLWVTAPSLGNIRLNNN